MGAWGYSSFENDDALDFITELVTAGDAKLVADTLTQAAEGTGASAMLASRALAAAEIVAEQLGHPARELPTEIQQWLVSHPISIDPQPACDAVIAILNDSELADLWREAGEYRKWKTQIINLLKRLGGELPPKNGESVKVQSPRAIGNHPGIHPVDLRARRILNKYYWKNGWLIKEEGKYVSPEEEVYAREAGFLVPDQVLTHDEVITWACKAVKKVNVITISNAFLASLSSRRLELRSALGSYAIGRHLSPHKYLNANMFACATCSLFCADNYKFEFSVLNFERYKWGGVRHCHPEYIAFDLTEFSKLPQCIPTDADIAIFRQIITVASSLPAKSGASALIKKLIAVFPTNTSECGTLVTILGYAGILQPTGYPSYIDQFVPGYYRNNLQDSEWKYPISKWCGADGVNDKALASIFPQV